MKSSPGIATRLRTSVGRFTLNVDMQVPDQGVSALFGPSGSGKTLLLRCIAGLHRAEGTVRIGDQYWQDAQHFEPVHRRPLAYVFQEASLFDHKSVQRNIEYGYKRVASGQRKITLEMAVEWLGLGSLLSRMPGKLSGGERQRVAIARALLTSPRVLLMDEPLSALDYNSKREIMPYLEQLHAELEMPVLYITHSPDEVAHLADQLVLFDNGRILAQGAIAETMARLDLPLSMQEGAGVILDAIAAERDERWHLLRCEFDGGSMWTRDPGLPAGKALRLRVLARDVSLTLEPATGTSIQNIMPATVEELQNDDDPALALVRVRIGASPLLVRLTRKSVASLGLSPGRHVWAQVKSVAIIE